METMVHNSQKLWKKPRRKFKEQSAVCCTNLYSFVFSSSSSSLSSPGLIVRRKLFHTAKKNTVTVQSSYVAPCGVHTVSVCLSSSPISCSRRRSVSKWCSILYPNPLPPCCKFIICIYNITVLDKLDLFVCCCCCCCCITTSIWGNVPSNLRQKTLFRTQPWRAQDDPSLFHSSPSHIYPNNNNGPSRDNFMAPDLRGNG